MSDVGHRPEPQPGMQSRVPAGLRAATSRPRRVRLWVVLLSVLVVLIVGGMILTDTDEVPPSDYRGTPQVAPNGGTAPSAPHPEPQTKQ